MYFIFTFPHLSHLHISTMEHYIMNLKLKVWRQKNAKSPGRFEII